MHPLKRAELLGRAVERLQITWEKNTHIVALPNRQREGIRSTQVISLLLMLIDMGVITPEILDELGDEGTN